MNHIFLVGFMGVGKTHVGGELSLLTKKPLIDTDETIEKVEGRSITKIFKMNGEGYFRRLEHMILKKIGDMEPSIVSCGGGMAIREENVELMKKYGKVIYLKATPETILKRVEHTNYRPLLEGKKNIKDISELMEGRIGYYSKAADYEITVDNRESTDIVAEIISLVDF